MGQIKTFDKGPKLKCAPGHDKTFCDSERIEGKEGVVQLTVADVLEQLQKCKKTAKVVMEVDFDYYPVNYVDLTKNTDTGEAVIGTSARRMHLNRYRYHIVWDDRTDHYIGHKQMDYVSDEEAIAHIPHAESRYTGGGRGTAHVVEVERIVYIGGGRELYESIWTNHR